jgi:hypothetical protein
MTKLKYTIIKSKRQYNEYCKALEHLVSKKPRRETDQEILFRFWAYPWNIELFFPFNFK